MSKRLRPLSGLDALFLYLESAGTPMHVASLLRIEIPKGRRRFAEVLRDHLQVRLARVPMLRRVLVETPLGLGHPVWQDVTDVDFAAHVRLERLRAPGGDVQLDALLARLHAQPLDRARPLWEVVMIDGLATREVAVYLKSHHALVDGQAGVRLAQAIFDLAPLPAEHVSAAETGKTTTGAGAPAPDPMPASARAALLASARQFGQMVRGVPAHWRQLREAAKEGEWMSALRDSLWLAPRTPFNVNLGPKRSLAFCSLPIDAVKQVAHKFEVSLNDVVMALVADSLRNYLKKRRQLPHAQMIAAMPVSLRGADSQAGNEVSMVQCPLATDIADPLERLRAISQATRAIKGRVKAVQGLIPTDFPGLAAPIWATGLSRLWQRGRFAERLPPLANLVVSNVPGPALPLYLGGGRIRHYFPISIVTHGLGVNITLLSYAGQLEFGVVGAHETLAKPEALAGELERSLNELLERCRT